MRTDPQSKLRTGSLSGQFAYRELSLRTRFVGMAEGVEDDVRYLVDSSAGFHIRVLVDDEQQVNKVYSDSETI